MENTVTHITHVNHHLIIKNSEVVRVTFVATVTFGITSAAIISASKWLKKANQPKPAT